MTGIFAVTAFGDCRAVLDSFGFSLDRLAYWVILVSVVLTAYPLGRVERKSAFHHLAVFSFGLWFRFEEVSSSSTTTIFMVRQL